MTREYCLQFRLKEEICFVIIHKQITYINHKLYQKVIDLPGNIYICKINNILLLEMQSNYI